MSRYELKTATVYVESASQEVRHLQSLQMSDLCSKFTHNSLNFTLKQYFIPLSNLKKRKAKKIINRVHAVFIMTFEKSLRSYDLLDFMKEDQVEQKVFMFYKTSLVYSLTNKKFTDKATCLKIFDPEDLNILTNNLAPLVKEVKTGSNCLTRFISQVGKREKNAITDIFALSEEDGFEDDHLSTMTLRLYRNQ